MYVRCTTAEAGSSVRSAAVAAQLSPILVWLVYATVALFPITIPTTLWASDGPANSFTLEPYELVLLVFVFASLADAIEGRRLSCRPAAWSLTTGLVAAAALVWSVSLALHPSWKGLDLALGLAGAWAVGRAVHRSTSEQQTRFLSVVVAVGALEAVLGAAQSFSGNLTGLYLFEAPARVNGVGRVAAAIGSTTNQNSLGAVLVLAIAAGVVLYMRLSGVFHRRAVLVIISAMSVTTSLTFSRAALLAIVPMLALLISSRSGRRVAVAITFGFAIGWIVAHDAVGSSIEQSTEADAFDSGRRPLITEALGVIAEHPLVGVGPGRYVMVVGDGVHGTPMPPHNVVIHVAAEAGVGAALLLVSAVPSFAWWLHRSGKLAVLAGVSLAPFLLLHTYPYTSHPTLLGLWLATAWVAANTFPPG